MASLKVLSDKPERIELGKGGGSAVGSLIGLAIFAVVTCIALFSILGEGGEFNPVMIIIFLVIGLVMLNGVAQLLSGTRVVLDAGQRLATRTRTLFLIPIQRQEMAFNLIRDVQVTRTRGAGAFALDPLPIWQVQLQATDGSTLIVNDRGTRSEMDALAQKVGTLLSRPVRAETQKPSAPQTPTNTPASVMTSLVENLAAFAQSAAQTSYPTAPAQTISLFPPEDAPRPRQARVERSAADIPYTRASEQLEAEQSAANASAAEINARLESERSAAFATGVEIQKQLSAAQTAARAPFVRASERLAQEQTATQAEMGYSMPPMLTMPQMPSLQSFAPALNMPSFAPLGAGLEVQQTEIPATPEIKEVQAQVSPTLSARRVSDEVRTLLRQARQMVSARNFRGAQEVYLRALSTNPADAAIQNDLGVVYYEQNKLQDAERAFRRAIALDPFLNSSRYNLGMVLQRMGKRDAAREQFQIGAQTATRDEQEYFRDGLRGNLRAPLSSPPS